MEIEKEIKIIKKQNEESLVQLTIKEKEVEANLQKEKFQFEIKKNDLNIDYNKRLETIENNHNDKIISLNLLYEKKNGDRIKWKKHINKLKLSVIGKIDDIHTIYKILGIKEKAEEKK